jgi:hypothetical protein
MDRANASNIQYIHRKKQQMHAAYGIRASQTSEAEK